MTLRIGELVRLVNSRFKKVVSKNSLDELKSLYQTGSVEDYWVAFERLRSKMILEGRQFFEKDYTDAFISGLKGEIKPFVQAFKPNSLEGAVEYGFYMESATKNQFKRLRGINRLPVLSNQILPKTNPNPKPLTTTAINKPSLIEQRRALGQYFKCGDRYYPGHQYKLKIHMILEHNEGEMSQMEEETSQMDTREAEVTEEAIVSMHATSNHPMGNTMRFKGQIGRQPVFALIDSGSTHSFVNPQVLHSESHKIAQTNPMVVMVENGSKMVTDSTCQSLQFNIQGYEFCHDLRLLPVQGYDVIFGLDWLAKLGPMHIDWLNKWIEFEQEDKRVKLQVTTDTVVLRLCEAMDLNKELKSHNEVILAQIWLCEGSQKVRPPESKHIIPSELVSLLDQFATVFENSPTLPPSRAIDHAIPLIPNAKTVNLRPYRYSYFQKMELEKSLKSC
jgi:Retroviral aspartyl protease